MHSQHLLPEDFPSPLTLPSFEVRAGRIMRCKVMIASLERGPKDAARPANEGKDHYLIYTNLKKG